MAACTGYIAAVRRFSADPGRLAGGRASAPATIRPSPGCTRPRQPWRAARSGPSRRSCAATSSTPITPAAVCTTPCGRGRAASASTTTWPWRSPGPGADGLRVLYVDLDVHHGDGVQALHYADPGVLTISFHESGRSLFPGHRIRGRDRGGDGGGNLGQRAARADDGAGCVARRGSGGRSAPRRGVRAGHRGQPARRRRPRLGSAGTSVADDDGDGRGRAAGRSGRAPIRRRALARDGRRRVFGLSRRAAGLGADLAGGGASRGAGEAARELAGEAGRATRPGGRRADAGRFRGRRRFGRVGPRPGRPG